MCCMYIHVIELFDSHRSEAYAGCIGNRFIGSFVPLQDVPFMLCLGLLKHFLNAFDIMFNLSNSELFVFEPIIYGDVRVEARAFAKHVGNVQKQ